MRIRRDERKVETPKETAARLAKRRGRRARVTPENKVTSAQCWARNGEQYNAARRAARAALKSGPVPFVRERAMRYPAGSAHRVFHERLEQGPAVIRGVVTAQMAAWMATAALAIISTDSHRRILGAQAT